MKFYFCFFAILLVSQPFSSRAQEEAVQSANSSAELESAFGVYFDENDEFSESRQESSTLAIQLAWRKCVAQIRLSNTDFQKKIAIARFTGWLEGRTKVAIPNDWEKAILNSSIRGYNGRTEFVFDSVAGSFLRANDDWYIQRGSQLSFINEQVIVTDSVGKYAVPNKTMIYAIEHFPGICISTTRDEAGDAFVFVHGIVIGVGNGQLVKFDNKTGAKVWENNVLGGITLVGGTSGITHQTFLVTDEKCVTVFCFGQLQAFAESFEISTGSAQWKFSTSYTSYAK